jgi:WD40 repeat protein
VTAIAVGQCDGRPVVVSGSDDGTLRLLDPTTHQELTISTGSAIRTLTFYTGAVVVGASNGLMLVEPSFPLA